MLLASYCSLHYHTACRPPCSFNAANEEIEKLRAEVGAKEGEVRPCCVEAEGFRLGWEVGWGRGWRLGYRQVAEQATHTCLAALTALDATQPCSCHSTALPIFVPPCPSASQVRDAKQAEQEFAAECERLDREFAQERQRLQVRRWCGVGGWQQAAGRCS